MGRVLARPGERVTAQYRLRHKDGSWRWVEAVGTNLLDDPSVKAIVVNHRDITEQKEADRRKEEWLAMLAHELRGPLAPISNAVQVLIRIGPADPEIDRARDVIVRQTRHLARIVDGLLEVTRLLRGEIRLQKERMDLGRLVRADRRGLPARPGAGRPRPRPRGAPDARLGRWATPPGWGRSWATSSTTPSSSRRTAAGSSSPCTPTPTTPS